MLLTTPLVYSQTLNSVMVGFKGIIETLLVLNFAWAIGGAFVDLKVADFVVSGMDGTISPGLLPTIIFVFSLMISLSTGTSWGTMTIVFPLAVPLAEKASGGQAYVVETAISAILTGSLFGDMCTPFSDTSILSSVGSAVSVPNHVSSIFPYSILCATLSAIFYLPVAFGIWPGWVSFLAGIPPMILVVFLFGTKVESDEPSKLWFIERHFKKYQRTVMTDINAEQIDKP